MGENLESLVACYSKQMNLMGGGPSQAMKSTKPGLVLRGRNTPIMNGIILGCDRGSVGPE